MTTITATEAKLHFGVLIDRAQHAPVTIEKQGRPVAVVVSFDTYEQSFSAQPNEEEKRKSIQFLERWNKRPVQEIQAEVLQDDPRAAALWSKYSQSA